MDGGYAPCREMRRSGASIRPAEPIYWGGGTSKATVAGLEA